MTETKLNFGEFTQATHANLAAPTPIAIDQADAAFAAFASQSNEMDKVAAFKMFCLAWSSLRTATLMANMGLVVQTPAVQRQALESIFYGYLFMCDTEFHQLWKKRHEDEEAKRKFRYEGFSRAKKTIGMANPDLAERMQSQYEYLIDIGAHPNFLSIDQMVTFQIEDGAALGSAEFKMVFGQPHVAHSHGVTFEIYIMLIDAIRDTWPDRCSRAGVEGLKKRALASGLDFVRDTRG